MNNTFIEAPTRAFWVISGLALVWNLMGVAAYLAHVTMSPEAYAAMAPDVRTLYDTAPSWVTGAYAVAVFGGALACIFLLLRKTWAVPMFVISLIGVLLQFGYSLLLSDTLAVMGPQAVIMPLVVIGIGIFLLMFSRDAAKRGVLR